MYIEDLLLSKMRLKKPGLVSPFFSGSGPTAPVNHDKLLGEPDGKGFGIGVANAPIKANTMTLLATRGKIKSRRGKDAIDPTETKRAETQGQDEGKSTATTDPRTQRQGSLRPTTPPPKSDAFVEFKQERGSEISRILHENKGRKYETLVTPDTTL